MKHFSLYDARGVSPRQLARMLAREASDLEAYYRYEASGLRISGPNQFGEYETIDPCEHDELCRKAEEADDLAMMLENSMAIQATLNMAAQRLATHFKALGDTEMADEMTALIRERDIAKPTTP